MRGAIHGPREHNACHLNKAQSTALRLGRHLPNYDWSKKNKTSSQHCSKPTPPLQISRRHKTTTSKQRMLKMTRATLLLSMGDISEEPTVEWRMKDLTAQDVVIRLRKAIQLAASLCASPTLQRKAVPLKKHCLTSPPSILRRNFIDLQKRRTIWEQWKLDTSYACEVYRGTGCQSSD